MKVAYNFEAFHKYRGRRKIKWLKIVDILVTLIIFVAIFGMIFEFFAGRVDEGKYKKKGTLININKYRLFTNVSGKGKTTVIFQSDIDSSMLQWSKVKEELTSQYRVVTYDRAGYGWSDSFPQELTLEQSVKELRTLLNKTAISSPYILVGQGYGGLIMTKYAQEHPEEVLGIILLDGLSETEIKSEEFVNSLKLQIAKNSFNRYFSNISGMRLLDSLGLLKQNEQLVNAMKEEEFKVYRAQRVRPKFSKTNVKELKILKNYNENIQGQGVLKDKPLIVVTHIEKGINDEERNKEINYQKELLDMSSNGEHIILEDNDKYFYLKNTSIIKTAIDSIIKKINS